MLKAGKRVLRSTKEQTTNVIYKKNPEVVNLHEKCRKLEHNLLTKDLALKQAKKRISQLETYLRIRAYNAKVRVPESDINMRIVQKMHNDRAAGHHTSPNILQTMSLESGEEHSTQEVRLGTNSTTTLKENITRTNQNPTKFNKISSQYDISEKSFFEYRSGACNPDASNDFYDMTSTQIIKFNPSHNSETTNKYLENKIASSQIDISETDSHRRVASVHMPVKSDVKGLAKLHQLVYSMNNSSTKRHTLQLDSLDRNIERLEQPPLTLHNKNKNPGDEGTMDKWIGYDEELNHFIEMFRKSNTLDSTNSVSDSNGENSSGDNDL